MAHFNQQSRQGRHARSEKRKDPDSEFRRSSYTFPTECARLVWLAAAARHETPERMARAILDVLPDGQFRVRL